MQGLSPTHITKHLGAENSDDNHLTCANLVQAWCRRDPVHERSKISFPMKAKRACGSPWLGYASCQLVHLPRNVKKPCHCYPFRIVAQGKKFTGLLDACTCMGTITCVSGRTYQTSPDLGQMTSRRQVASPQLPIARQIQA